MNKSITNHISVKMNHHSSPQDAETPTSLHRICVDTELTSSLCIIPKHGNHDNSVVTHAAVIKHNKTLHKHMITFIELKKKNRRYSRIQNKESQVCISGIIHLIFSSNGHIMVSSLWWVCSGLLLYSVCIYSCYMNLTVHSQQIILTTKLLHSILFSCKEEAFLLVKHAE